MNWRTPVYWFFCKINDPIFSPSTLFDSDGLKCIYCRKCHGNLKEVQRSYFEQVVIPFQKKVSEMYGDKDDA